MKNFILCGLLAAGCCFSAASQDKLSGHAQLMLQKFKMEKAASRAASNTEVMAIITLNDGFKSDVLEAKGLKIVSAYDEICIVSLPLNRAEEIAAMAEVKAVSFGHQSGMYLDKAREVSNVDIANAGSDPDLESYSYTGKGVVTGLYDTGLDPNHAAFRNADGSSRVKAVFQASGYSDATVREYTTPEQIATFTTDKASETHGTHVAGIMAGSKGVNGEYVFMNGSRVEAGNGDIPYYGVAYNSDLVIGCGDFYDASILAGVSKVVEYAKQLGKPAVVNLSLGGNSGSHDPNSSVSKLMDRLGQDAIICIAAGNEGQSNMAIQKNFKSLGTAGKTLNTFITPDNPAIRVTYTAEFWANDGEPFEDAKIVLYDKSTNQIVDSKTITKGTTTWTPKNSAKFAEVYDSNSSVSVNCGVDAETGRYYIVMSNSMLYNGGSSFVAFGINITGKNNKSCYAYVNTGYGSAQEAQFTNDGVAGYTAGSPDGSINGFGCGHNMVSVGSYTSRVQVPLLSNSAVATGGVLGAISDFSSYGKTGDGRQLPHVAAPGQQLISSISSYYYDNVMEKRMTSAFSTSYNRNNPYNYMQGTSMATPFAAGVIALWLEAKPDATIDDIHDIIERSSKTDAQTAKDFKRFGAGKIDALQGLRVALGKVSIKETLKDQVDKNLMYTISGKNIQVIVPGIDSFDVTLYNLQGAAVAAAKAAGETADIDASNLSDGIYLMTANTAGGKVTRKIVLK